MSLRNGVIKAGTIVWKKVTLYRPLENVKGIITEGWRNGEVFNADTCYCWTSVGTSIAKLIVLEDGVIPTIHRRGTKLNNSWEGGHRKCRVPKAYVVEVEGLIDGNRACGRNWLNYPVGSIVTPNSYNNDPKCICTNGIHVFLTRTEAEVYPL